MNSIKSGGKCNEPQYPCLMISGSSCVYLMANSTTGMRVYATNKSHNLGEYASNYNLGGSFKPYTGSICLEN